MKSLCFSFLSYLSIYLCIYLPIYLPVYLHLYIYLCINLSHYQLILTSSHLTSSSPLQLPGIPLTCPPFHHFINIYLTFKLLPLSHPDSMIGRRLMDESFDWLALVRGVYLIRGNVKVYLCVLR